MALRPFRQVDVFTTEPYRGNPVAVVLDGQGLNTGQMQRFANWTNLSETTFVLPPGAPEADYRLRIFTASHELPFAGHPTLGSAHAWLEGGGTPKAATGPVQECAAGLVQISRSDTGLAFAAPPLRRAGAVADELVDRLAEDLGIDRSGIVDVQWADNGPGWVALLLPSAEDVLALLPGRLEHFVGVVGPYPAGSAVQFEVRAFTPGAAGPLEDPVTGSLNAAVAQWLVAAGHATAPYVASQGTVLGRAGRVHITRDGRGTIWTGGGTVTCISGEVDL